MVSSFFPTDVQVFRAIERLLRTSGYDSWNLVSVCDEASRYCYKTVSGEIGTVRKDFLHDRINSGLI
jgi:hypothetical protein